MPPLPLPHTHSLTLIAGTIALLDDGEEEKERVASALDEDDDDDENAPPVHLTLDDTESAKVALARARNLQRRGSAGSVVCTLAAGARGSAAR